jgi:hypothetical protein
MMTLDQKLALMDRKAAQRHRARCTYDMNGFSPDSDYCSCDLHERKSIIQAEIDKLDG